MTSNQIHSAHSAPQYLSGRRAIGSDGPQRDGSRGDEQIRARWPIDDLLKSLTGHVVRVQAEAFAPIAPNLDRPIGRGRLTKTRDLVLPDNSSANGLPVFFEGNLVEFNRQIGIVHVRLDAPPSSRVSAGGLVRFRGQTAIVLAGPAVVQLAYPFHVERIPADEGNYWLDLHLPAAQFILSLNPHQE